MIEALAGAAVVVGFVLAIAWRVRLIEPSEDVDKSVVDGITRGGL